MDEGPEFPLRPGAPCEKLLVFDEGPHTYTYEGRRHLSVTQLIGLYEPEFPEDARATERAARDGCTKRDVLAAWAELNQQGRDLGTRVHDLAERILLGKPLTEADKRDHYYQHIAEVAKKMGAGWRRTEWRICSPELRIAGTVDLLIDINGLWIVDWKTNKKKLTEWGWKGERLLAPVSHLQNASLVKYGLQLSTYQYILERDWLPKEVRVQGRAIVHFHRERKRGAVPPPTTHTVRYYKNDVIALAQDYQARLAQPGGEDLLFGDSRLVEQVPAL